MALPKRTRLKPPTTRGTAERKGAGGPSSKRDLVGREVRLFVSYSHQDAAARAKLHTHLAPWRRDGVEVFYDGNIDPGAELGREIARELRRAHIFVALLSPAYLDSNYCWNIEYARAMGRRARGLVRVVGVVVKPCSWKRTSAARFKLLPKDGVPPERWSSADAAFVDIAEGIGEVIRTVRRELAANAPVRSQAVVAAKPKPKPKPKPPNAAPSASTRVRKTTSSKSPKPRTRSTAAARSS